MIDVDETDGETSNMIFSTEKPWSIAERTVAMASSRLWVSGSSNWRLIFERKQIKRKEVGSGEVKEEGISSFSCRAKKWSDCETYVYQSSLELLRLDDS